MLRLADRRIRAALITIGALVVLGVLWWSVVLGPIRERSGDLDLLMEQKAMELHQLEKRLKKYKAEIEHFKGARMALARIRRFGRERNTLEEANAITLAKVQEFLNQNEIPLRTYKEVAPAKWRNYPVGRLEFQLNTSTRGLARLLQFLEGIDDLVKVEKLTVTSRRKRRAALTVMIRLNTLFVTEAIREQTKKDMDKENYEKKNR